MIDSYAPNDAGWARFSTDQLHRYRLARPLVPGLGPLDRLIATGEITADGRLVRKIVKVTFVLVNPSTADAFKPDPTVSKCCQFAQRWGADVLEVVNLFSFRSPFPKDLKTAADPGAGPDNDAEIIAGCAGATRVIVGWGANGALHNRATRVCELLAGAGVIAEHLGTTGDGFPKHPLARGHHFIPLDYTPQPYELVPTRSV